MKNVSDLFKESCNEDIVNSQFKVLVSNNITSSTLVTLESDDFVENSLSISSYATSSYSFTIGGVCSSKLSLTLTRQGVSKLKAAYAFKKGLCWRVIQWNKVDDENQNSEDFSVNIDGTENSSGKCKLGVFYVSKIDNNDYSCDIEAYDGMLAFEKSINAAKINFMRNNLKTAEGWVEYMLSFCNVKNYKFGYRFGDNLVNTDLEVKLSDDVDVETFREALGYLTILVGGFATFDEDGDLLIRTYEYTPVELTMSHKRLLSGKFDSEISEVTAFYSSVAGFDYENSVTESDTSNNVEVYVSENPFLRGIQEYNQAELNEDILTALSNISSSLLTKLFYGCDITVTAMPYLELGDCISVNRLVVSESGVSSDIVDSNIIVCDMQYNFGSSLGIQSMSTDGNSSSNTAGSVGSNPKESENKDGRVDDLIDAFAGIKYEERTVKIPITYDNSVMEDTSSLTSTIEVECSVSFNDDTSSYSRSQALIVKSADFTSPRGVTVTEAETDTASGEDLISAYNISGESDSVLSYVTDDIESIDNIQLIVDFTDAMKATGISCMSMNTPLVSFYVEGGLTYTKDDSYTGESGESKYTCDIGNEDYYVDAGLSVNWWLSPPRSNAVSTIHLNFYDGGLIGYSLDEDRPLFSCGVSGSWDATNVSSSSLTYNGSAEAYFTTPSIKTGVFVKDGSNSEEETGAAGINKSYTLDEFKSAFGNNESLSVRIEGSFKEDWNRGSGSITGTKSYSSPTGTSSGDVDASSVNLTNLFNSINTETSIGTYGDFIKANDVDPSFNIVYDNLPEYATLKYRVKIEVPKDIDSVIDAINQGVSANEDVEAIKAAVEILNTNVDSLSSDVSNMGSRVDSVEADVSELKSCCSEVNTVLSELSTSVDTLNTGYADLSSSIVAISATLESINSEIAVIKVSVAQIDEMKSQIADLDTRVTALESGQPTVVYSITDMWFEDADGFKFDDNYLDGDGNYRIPSGVSFYIGISVSQEDSTNSFFYIDTDDSRVQFGSDTTDTKSTATSVSSDSSVGYLAKAVWESLGKEAISDIKNVLGFEKFSMSSEEAYANQDVNLVTITNTPSNGYPSIGIGEYLYKFVLSSTAGESGEVKVLQDWSTNSSISFTIGSDEVNNMTDLWVRWYITDGYITELFSQEFVEKVAKSITDIWFEDADGFKFTRENAMDADGNIRILASVDAYICISTSETGSVNSFYKVGTSSNSSVGEQTTDLKSTATVNAGSGGATYFATAYWEDDSYTAESDQLTVVSYTKLSASSSNLVVTQDGNNCSIHVVPSGGYPSVGIGSYQYKFVLSSSSGSSGEIKTLQDWSDSDTYSFVLGSEEVDSRTTLYIRYYVRDMYTEGYYGYKKFTA